MIFAQDVLCLVSVPLGLLARTDRTTGRSRDEATEAAGAARLIQAPRCHTLAIKVLFIHLKDAAVQGEKAREDGSRRDS